MNNDFLKNKTEELISLCGQASADGSSIVITGHDMPDCDSLISAVMLRELLARLGIKTIVKFGTRPDGVTERLVSNLGVLDNVGFDGYDKKDKLILVDHHQCFYQNKAIACVDHHTTPPEPDFALNLVQQASSCGRIVFNMSLSCGVADEWMEEMAVHSVYFDTQSTLAPKFEKSDLPWLKHAISRLQLDEKELIKKGFCLNSPDEDAEVLMMYAYKKYEFGGKQSASGCLQIDHTQAVWQDRIDEVISRIEAKICDEKIFGWALVINKPLINKSDIYFVQPSSPVKLVKLDRLASRSRDVVPYMKNL